MASPRGLIQKLWTVGLNQSIHHCLAVVLLGCTSPSWGGARRTAAKADAEATGRARERCLWPHVLNGRAGEGSSPQAAVGEAVVHGPCVKRIATCLVWNGRTEGRIKKAKLLRDLWFPAARSLQNVSRSFAVA